MSKVIEETVKALTEFESALDVAMAESSESKKRLAKNAAEWADAAKATAVSRAQEIASRRLAAARGEAEKEVEGIQRRGLAALKKFEDSISKRKPNAVEYVMARLLGETE